MPRFRRLAAEVADKEAKNGAIMVTQVGSTLRPKEMFYDSDLDIVAVYPGILPAGASRFEYKFNQKHKIEVNIIREPLNTFIRKLTDGNPFETICAQFGQPIVGKRILDDIPQPKPTFLTAARWMDNAAYHLSNMMAEYPMVSGTEFYTAAQKAARSALRAAVLVETKKLVETNADLVSELPTDIRDMYLELLTLRRESEHYNDTFTSKKVRSIKPTHEGKAFLTAEYLVRYGAKKVLSLNVPTLNAVLKDKIRTGESYQTAMLDFRDRRLIVLLRSKDGTSLRDVTIHLY